jgi:hypothetical protein
MGLRMANGRLMAISVPPETAHIAAGPGAFSGWKSVAMDEPVYPPRREQVTVALKARWQTDPYDLHWHNFSYYRGTTIMGLFGGRVIFAPSVTATGQGGYSFSWGQWNEHNNYEVREAELTKTEGEQVIAFFNEKGPLASDVVQRVIGRSRKQKADYNRNTTFILQGYQTLSSTEVIAKHIARLVDAVTTEGKPGQKQWRKVTTLPGGVLPEGMTVNYNVKSNGPYTVELWEES